jgi:hypothetical protein
MTPIHRLVIGILALACCSCASTQVSNDKTGTYKGGMPKDTALMGPEGCPMYKCEIPDSAKVVEFTGAPGDFVEVSTAQKLCGCARSEGILSLHEKAEEIAVAKGVESPEV